MGRRWNRFQQSVVESQLWKSIFRVGVPNTNRKRVLAMLGNVVLHLHPVKTRKSGVKMRYTWCAGGVTFFLFLVLTFTGLLLMFYYRPTVEYAFGVDERWKAKYRVWIVRNTESVYALVARCTHLGCTPNWLQAQNKFKCPCHGSGYYMSGVNFEGPTPRPLARAEITLSPDDGQLVVDTAVRYLYERGQWSDPKAFVKMI